MKALSAPLVHPWQVNWQGLHLGVGGVGTEHWHWTGLLMSTTRVCLLDRTSAYT